jgi:hypothetical protein
LITYLACPYTHPDPSVRRARFDAVTRLAARLIQGGEVIYAPICHSHPITETGLPMAWDFWRDQSLAMLAVCDQVLVYCLDGWEHSVGVMAEIAAATQAGKRVRYHYPEMEGVLADG